MKKDIILQRFLTCLPSKFRSSSEKSVFTAVLVEVKNKKATTIERIQIHE